MAGIVNPHLGTDTEDGWAMGFSWGFLGPAFSSDPPLVIAPEQLDAFNEGVLAGQQAAIEGLTIDPACVSLAQEVSSAAEAFMEGLHIFEGGGILSSLGSAALFGKHLAHAGVEGLMFVFLLMIPGPPPLSATDEFANVGTAVRNRLAELGLAGRALFLAAGIDENASGCELQMTSVFTDADSARTAVQAQGRPHWVLARWDADAPVSGGGFEVVETDAG